MIFKSFFYDTFTHINKINLLKTNTNYKIKICDKHMKTFNEIKEELKNIQKQNINYHKKKQIK